MYFRSYQDSEEIKANSTSCFANREISTECSKKNLSSFDKLDDNGFIQVGEKITSDDMITGKCVRDGERHPRIGLYH